jgi:DNA adenine methylase
VRGKGESVGVEAIKAPFPYAGGKSRVAEIVWDHFDDVPNYVEPFAGSLAVLLGRPTAPGTETVNDLDSFLSNFWRALKNDPEAVAKWADFPVSEIDILARHDWLIAQNDFKKQMRANPDFYDVKIAGWWVWGLCAWIGGGWCCKTAEQLPHLGDAGRGDLVDYFNALAARLQRVRICCGDWSRCLGESVTIKHGTTGVFLDPPYLGERNQKYSIETERVGVDVVAWAIDNGDNPLLRIALCGYEGTYDMPTTWEKIEWKAAGGYGSQSDDGLGRDNCAKERIWFSPHCIKKSQLSIFDQEAA